MLEWIAEGLESDEINSRAGKFDPPFHVTRQNVDRYRKSRRVVIDELRKSFELRALNDGLANRSVRIEKLKSIAAKLEKDLLPDEDDKIWTLEVKGVGSGPIAEIVEYYEFNRSEIDAYRGILDDIARETGGRVQKTDLTSDGKAIVVTLVRDDR